MSILSAKYSPSLARRVNSIKFCSVVAACLLCLIVPARLTAAEQTKDAKSPVLVPENLAKGKPATASSSQEGHDPSDGNDGDAKTRWCADGGGLGEWWQVDLGKAEEVTGCRIAWEKDEIYQFKVEGSADGKKWMMLADQTKDEAVNDLKFNANGIRHVRITIVGLAEGAWASFFECQVLGAKMVNAQQPPTEQPKKQTRPARTGAALPQRPAGFDITMFAAPPDITYPTCLTATPDGVLFVGVDLNSSLGARPKRGKIVRCIDTDGGGKADKFNTFVEVDSPRGLWFDNNTLYVLHPPFLSAYHDDNGDGVSDREEVLVKGIGFDLKFRGADHTTNGIRMGIDGWIYIACGDYGFIKAEGKDGTVKQLRGGGIARVRPDGSGLEVVCEGTRNIYDVAVSPTLDIFTRDNTNDGGGWDVRLAHNVATANYGYPRLFVNFPDEHIKPLLDTGGGAPTGSIFIDEPGYPEGYGRGLYTCEWGRSQVDLHPLTANGSTFKAEKKTFLNIPRPTDIDVDGSGRMYVSSWKDGGYDFSKPDIGFIVRVTPKDWKLTPFPDLKKASDEELLSHLASASAVRRLYAQREILRRGPKSIFVETLERLAGSHDSIAVRVAAIFTLKQLLGEKSHDALLKLLKQEVVREYALKALADDLKHLDKVSTQSFADALRDPSPRVRLQAVIGLNRLHKAETAASLLPLTADTDGVVAHVAVKALVSLNAIDVCLKALDSADTSAVAGALRALQAIHETPVVDGLLARLEQTKDAELRKGLLKTLARLCLREADWDGKWWSTRPDTRGPYYNPVAWKETERIRKQLSATAASADAETLRWLFMELQRNRIETPELGVKILKLAVDDASLRKMAVDAYATRTDIPVDAIPFFIEIAGSAKETAALRMKAIRALLRFTDNSKTCDALINLLTKDAKPPREMSRIWEEFVLDGRHVQDVKRFVELTHDASVPKRELAWGVLATIADRNLGNKDLRAIAENAILQAWTNPESALPLLKSIGRLNLTSYAPQIRTSMAGSDAKIAAAAKTTLAALRIDPNARNLPLVGKLKYEEVTPLVLKEKGDAVAGAKIFQRTGCINCHTISPTETLKGPLLAGITARYNRTELIESILKPSAKIAQGFETHIFELTNGKKITGFIVKESGADVEVRDSNGVVIVIKKADIDERKTSLISVMPEKLVDNLTAPELASILAYLESLGGKK